MRRSGAAALLLSLAATAVAGAHAYVVATTPMQDESLGAPPSAVTISFDEPVSVESREALVVRAGDGSVAPCVGGARVNPDDVTQLVCRFAHPLERGAYTVAWRVTSVDTHVVHGVFAFGVGRPATAVRDTGSLYDPSGWLAALLRWLCLVGAIAVAGTLGFARFVARLPRANALVGAGLALSAIANAVALDVHAAAATGTDLVHALPQLGAQAFTSIWGATWLARMAALALIAASYRRRERRDVALVGSALLLMTFSASGHALSVGAAPLQALAIVMDWLHLSAAALWTGGVLVFAVGLRPALRTLPEDERVPFARRCIARFSRLAIASVAAIVVTGTIGTVFHVHSLVALLGSSYGGLILLKAELLIPLLFLGYGNYRKGLPGARDTNIERSVTYEAVVLLVVIGLTAILTGIDLPHRTL